jgi:autotransporter adhesin
LNALGTTVSGISNGGGIKYFHTNSTGPDSSATGADSVAVGPSAVASAANGVALGAGAVENRGAQSGYTAAYLTPAQNSVGAVSVGAAGAERQITNVAAGSAATDAVNVSQLQGAATAAVTTADAYTDSRIATIGNSEFTVNNSAASPLAVATGTNSVAGGAGASASGINSVALGNSATATGLNSVVLGAGSTDGGQANVVSVGSLGDDRRVTNVGAGTLSPGSTDAVNGSQLYATNQSLAALDQSVLGLSSELHQARENAYAGIAGALALDAPAYVPGKLTYSAGVGAYEDQAAVGIALRRTADNGRWSISGGIAASSSGVGGRLGISGVID